MDRLLRFLTVEELAEKLQVPLSWVYSRTRLKTKDAIPKIKVGKYYRFDEAEVLAWLKDQQNKQ